MMKEALLIVDMSNDFVADDGSLTVGKAAQQIVPEIIRLANEFIENGQVVAICMDAHEENDEHFTLWPPHNIKGTKGQQLYGDLYDWYEQHKPLDQVLYIPKAEYDAFFNTSLEEELKRRHVTKVHIAGVCTDICDFLTAYGAYARGFQTVAYKRATATFTNHHDTFLQKMNAIFKTEIR
ncbi:cysteine hydrolase family protein [Massilibacterium senegalense]|uniref:cysteine hydrolase family protein n=1 Tax=Massilibacterium senegalense TaxID=1632858 RepID=UPI00164CE32B|nr:isochorismatase family cysteine hydrolase [Massilibacterium senegalense]